MISIHAQTGTISRRALRILIRSAFTNLISTRFTGSGGIHPPCPSPWLVLTTLHRARKAPSFSVGGGQLCGEGCVLSGPLSALCDVKNATSQAMTPAGSGPPLVAAGDDATRTPVLGQPARRRGRFPAGHGHTMISLAWTCSCLLTATDCQMPRKSRRNASGALWETSKVQET